LKNAKAYNNGKATAEDVGVKAVDELTLEVTLEKPTAYFIDLLCVTAYYPVRKDVVEAETVWTKSASTYVCNGPFMLSEIKPNEKYILARNPNYVDASNVKLDVLEMVFIEAPEAELAAYMSGAIDVSDNMSPEAVASYKTSAEFYSVPRIGVFFFDFNTEKKPFDDARIRRAFAMSIDRKQIVNDVLMLTVMNNQSNKDAAQAMQAMWKNNLGVNVEINTWESKVYWDEMANGNFMIMRDGWTGDYPDPMTNLEIFASSETYDDIRWENAEFDRLLDENRKITDKKKRMENYVKAEQILMEDMPVFPLYYLTDTFLAKPRVKGVIKNYICHTIFEFASVTE